MTHDSTDAGAYDGVIRGDRGDQYQPALDGVRAVAVVLVLLFHAGFAWMSGGYLGVSVFFTLSGFLITRLLVREQWASGRVSFSRFYFRRAKRLLPASLLCVVLIMLARQFGEFSHVESLRSDAVAAIGQFFNWHRLAGHSSYANLFADARGTAVSPLEHYWSLAIEEQFYLLWPVVLVGLLAVSRRIRRSVFWPIAFLAVAFGVAAPIIAAVAGPDAAYWATPARLAEILVGSALAVWLLRRPVSSSRVAHLALPSLAIVVAASVLVPSGRGPAYNGFLPLFALLSAALILALQVPGRVRRVLSASPLVAIGKISYGVYLFHWPVFVLMRQHGWDLTTPTGFAIAAAVTAAIALVSYTFVERPIREAKWQPGRTVMLASLGAGITALAVLFAPTAAPLFDVDEQALEQASIRPVTSLAPLVVATTHPATTTTTTTTTTVEPATEDSDFDSSPVTTVEDVPTTTTEAFPTVLALPPQPSRPVRILIFGDSTAVAASNGLSAWALDHAAYAQVTTKWSPGLGFIGDGVDTTFDSQDLVPNARQMLQKLPDDVRALAPDIVVLISTIEDVTNRRWSDDEGTLTPTDPRFIVRMTDAYLTIAQNVLDAGASRVVFVVPPIPVAGWPQLEMREPARYLAQHDVIRSVAAELGDRVVAIDVDRWFDESGASSNATIRPDGVHMTSDFSRLLAEQFLAPALIDAALGLADEPASSPSP